jgi:hypothetical protein
MGTMPCAVNITGIIRLARIGEPRPAAWSRGLAHQLMTRLNRPVMAIAVTPSSPSLTASQRVRVMLWVQARR